MSPEAQMLINILLAVVAGGASGPGIFGFIEWLQNFVTLSGPTKATLAVVLALLLPPGAYGLLVLLAFQPFDIAAALLAVFAGYAASQRIHYEVQRRETQEAAEGGAA